MYEIILGRDPADLKKYGAQGTAYIGKHIVGTGEDAHLTNKIRMDVVRPHVVLICGKRGTGKSYTGAVIAEEILNLPDEVKENLTVLMIDTMGIYWSTKNPNQRDAESLRNWDLKPTGFKTTLFVPEGQTADFDKAEIPWDKPLLIQPGELSVEDWALSFEISLIEPLGILLERTIRRIKKQKGSDYAIDDIIREIENDGESERIERQGLINRFNMAEGWGVFGPEGTKIEDLLKPGELSIIDVSRYAQVSAAWSIRGLLVGLLSRKIYEARLMARKAEEMEMMTGEKRKGIPMVWIIMDEAHQFLPGDEKTASTFPLLTLVKQGREPGISLCLITQRPNKLHEDALAQSDVIISHRLTAQQDLEALRAIMQTYMLKDIQKYIDELPRWKGAAIILDDNSEKIFSAAIRPRQSWHAGGSPIAIKDKEMI